eukprot:jgi/Botrbrau1/18081/Bobra.0062s0067.1
MTGSPGWEEHDVVDPLRRIPNRDSQNCKEICFSVHAVWKLVQQFQGCEKTSLILRIFYVSARKHAIIAFSNP